MEQECMFLHTAIADWYQVPMAYTSELGQIYELGSKDKTLSSLRGICTMHVKQAGN